jgi:bla regulator protein BlaR1
VSAIADHVWQSTWFAFAAWMFAACLRKDLAKVRCWIWLAASIKFLFPFALLTWIGRQFVVAVDDTTTLLPVVKQVASPLTSVNALSQVSIEAQWLLLALWAPICALFLQRLLLGWVESRALVRSSIQCDLLAPIELRSSCRIAAPCVVGVISPILLVPEHVLPELTQSQLEAVIAHELGHVRRRDNLLAYVQSFVRALFWFHPLVWLIGASLAKEREYACDEAAIEHGQEPLTYATNLLSVCRRSMTSDRIGVAYASSGNIAERIRVIMAAGCATKRSKLFRSLLVAAFVGSVALPVASGMNLIVTSELTVMPGTRLIRVSDVTGPSFLVVTNSYVYGRNVSLRELIGQAYAVSAAEVSGELRELDYPRYDVEIKARGRTQTDQRQLVAELLEHRFNVQLIIRNAPHARED